MPVRILDRIRHYKARFRHSRQTRVYGGKGGMAISFTASGGSMICSPAPPHVASQVQFAINVGGVVSTPTASIPVGATAEAVAALVDTALSGVEGITATASGRNVIVTAGGNNLTQLEVSGWTWAGGEFPEPPEPIDMDVEYRPDVYMGVITVNERSPDNDVTLRFRATMEGGASHIIDVLIPPNTAKTKVASMIAQAINAVLGVSADASGASVQVVGQGDEVLMDFVQL